jgi:subtilase family protein/Big-like domain-containing protein/IPT/TIG domain-containing protein
VGFVAICLALACRFSPARWSGTPVAALLKTWVRGRAFLQVAATVFVVLLCALGFATEAQAQFGPPTITSVNPNTGPAAGGTTVTITGTEFFFVTAVSFGGNAAVSYTVNSGTQITAISPAGTGTVDITVTAAGGTNGPSATDRFSYLLPPTVTGVAPNTGPAAGGTSVTITGTNFSGATAVRFGGNAAGTFSVVSATQITATSPAGTGTIDVTVTTPGGTSGTGAADQFTYESVPTVTAVNPNTGPAAGGTSVTVTGTNFSGATAVRFGGNAAGTFSVVSATQITATSPAGTGTIDVTVTTPGGTSGTGTADQFTYESAPTVTGVAPNTGPAAGGTSVTVTGTNFSGATAVRFGGNAAGTFSVVSATQITATSPAGTGTVDVTVTTPGGTSATSAADQFSYTSAPAVTGVNPNTGPPAGGTSVTITGTNFSGATAVRFGGNAAGSFSVVSATQITATSPAGTGTVDVTVTTAGGTSATGGGDQFTYGSAPAVTGVNPNTGPPSGGTSVTITGANFSGATAVRFGGNAAASFSVVSASQITATTPAGSAAVDVTVTTPNGSSAASSADQFSYGAAGTTTALSSSQNPSNSGQAVRFTATVTGASPTGTVTFLDGGAQIGSATLAGGVATFTTASLGVGSHSITARYGGDANNVASTSAALLQTVNVPSDSIKLRELQDSVTPIVANISGQAISGAIDSAIDAGFSDNPPAVTPNGSGFNFQIPLDQPAVTTIPRIGNPRPIVGGPAISFPIERRRSNGPGSLANGRQGGNGAPPGTRLIDMAFIPLPPRSGMPPPGETRFSPNEVILQFGAGTTPQQIAGIAQRFGLTQESQQAIGVLGRSVYTFRIANGQTVRQVIRAVEAGHVNAAVQPDYTYGLTQNQNTQNQNTQDQNNPNAVSGDPAQYIIDKFHLADAHRITNGDKVVIAVIDSQIDFNQPNLAGAITERYDAGCGATAPDPHGTGMAGAIVSHGQLEGVAPRASIIAICAFGGSGHPSANTVRIISGLDYAIQHGARIVNMSFAGPRDPALSQALQVAREKGVLLVAAAGNAGPKSPPLYPGADPSVMAVTATDEHDRLFNGANQGDYVTVAAPGVNVLVPAPDGAIQFTTGTSVATANVSGVAALLIAHKPSLKPEDIRALLVRTAKHLGSGGMNPQFGAGLVDPLKALETEVSQATSAQRIARQDTQQGTQQNTQQSAPQVRQQADLDSFLASPDGNKKRVADGFSALGYADDGSLWSKAPPLAAAPHAWLAWIDVRGADYERTTVGSDLKGVQVDTLAGITHRITPNFLVGVLGGYEHFDYSSQAFNGVLRGDGWTTGAYMGWRIMPNLRFDAGGAWSDIMADDTSGMATGNFLGHRWLVTTGLTGTYGWQAFVLEPSARVFALWEHENAYTDSLGTLQPDHNFSTGRASAGAKVTYPFAWTSTLNLAPYVGLYGDYYFSTDDAATAGLTTVPLLQGWSARATAGMAMTFSNSALVSLGGEYGGLGSDTHIWTWRVRGSVPF